MGTFPREVVIHSTYGCGFLEELYYCEFDGTNPNIKDPYDVLEHPIIIDALRTDAGVTETKDKCISAGFPNSVIECLFRVTEWGDTSFDWRSAVIVTVTEPYRICEYDGKESIEYQSAIKWRH